jgi:hypothetical protein
MTDQPEAVELRPRIQPVWAVKFFRDHKSVTPSRVAYMSYGTEDEVLQQARGGMEQEEACRVEIGLVALDRPMVAFGQFFYLD